MSVPGGIVGVAGRRAPISDSWIAATALTHDIAVVTQDTDHSAIPRVTVIQL
ncbi:MAG TPA: PIN domain-containing protein [Mycobacterium sp.]|nr:PIN domain-containing protein [Mycobacterium sp.]